MIEMRVRAVTAHPQSGRAIAVLQPRHAGPYRPLALTVTRAEACSLSHELVAKPTLRQQSLALLARCLAFRDARIVAIHLLPGPSGMVARLDLAWPDGRAETTIEVGQALGLAVTSGLPVLVAEALLAEQAPATETPSTTEVPTAYRRAFQR